MTQIAKPPTILAGTRVLEYAVVEGITYCGHGTLFKGNQEVGPVPCLAICLIPGNPEFHLFHCERDWSIVASPSYESVQEAKDHAEYAYPGSLALWIAIQVTDAEAAKLLDEYWGAMRCNFCKKTPLDFENPRFIEKNGSWICDSCVKACYEMLKEDDTSPSAPSA